MDDELLQARRAFGSARTPDVAESYARAALRAGEPLEALCAARVCAGDVHEEAAAAFAQERGLSFRGLEPAETFALGEHALALIPAGAFLDEGNQAWTSSLNPGGSRSTLHRVHLAAFLIGVWPHTASERRDAVAQAEALGGRLPSAKEWKKAWRGGLFLDGDEGAQRPNDEPDRLRPAGNAFAHETRSIERAPTSGLLFSLVDGAAEWVDDWTDHLVALASGGRYRVPLVRSDTTSLRQWRLVLDARPRAT